MRRAKYIVGFLLKRRNEKRKQTRIEKNDQQTKIVRLMMERSRRIWLGGFGLIRR